MTTPDISIAVIGIVLVAVGVAGMVILAWLVVRSELRRRHNQRERALSEARLQLHTHEAMRRLYDAARQSQGQRPPRDRP